mmetsp:Transcript_124695/g.349243  ORF Transcript_124695/g.349243 Transcript_124695/m.349243 type:complete len:460 (+) Transcript_124695:134-1513(+)
MMRFALVVVAGPLLSRFGHVLAEDHQRHAPRGAPHAIASALASAASAAMGTPRQAEGHVARAETLLELQATEGARRAVAGADAKAGILSFVLPHFDAATVTMLCCLLGVPLVTATAAFLFVEAGLRPQDPYRRRSYPPTGWQPGAAPAPGSSLRPGSSMGGSQPPRFGSSRMSLPGPRPASNRVPSYPHFGTSIGTFPDLPPTLPSTTAELPPGGAAGDCAFGGHDAAPPPPLPVLEDPTDDGGPRVSPLSTAVVVKNPAGALVRVQGVLGPHPEQKVVDIVSVKDGTSILRAILNEFGGAEDGQGCLNPFSADVAQTPGIRLETKAKSIPIAILDTRHAVYAKGTWPPAPAQRRVVLHRVGGDDGTAAGPACAWVQAAGRSKFYVHYLVNEPRIALTVHMTSSSDIDYIVDAQGQIVAKSEPMRPSNGSPSRAALWVKQGVDLALVSCISIAVQKLAA